MKDEKVDQIKDMLGFSEAQQRKHLALFEEEKIRKKISTKIGGRQRKMKE